MDALRAADPKVFEAVKAEERRQADGLELIASENYTSPAVLACQGSVLTNKYAEGYPGKRYYGGCEHVDTVEQLAIDRAKSLFGAEAANVQPHSGASANTAVFFAALEPKATILSMDLAHGGHLTHGMPLNYSGKMYDIVHYGVDKQTERLDYNLVRELAIRFKPKLLLAGASAYSRIIDFETLGAIAREVGALFMVDMAHISGLVAAGLHPNPVPHADFVTSTTHKTLRGPRSGFILCKSPWLKAINSSVFPGLQGGPLMHVVAAKAVSFGEAGSREFKEYAQQVIDNAQVLARVLSDGGLRLVSGGTDNHLMMVDVTSIPGMTGKIAEITLDHAGITCNKNMIPFDTRKPLDPSGIRLGTPALTSRGMKEGEMERVGQWILDVLRHADDAARVARIREDVRDFCQAFPVPGIEE